MNLLPDELLLFATSVACQTAIYLRMRSKSFATEGSSYLQFLLPKDVASSS